MRQWILTASALALACGTAQAQTAPGTDEDATLLDRIVVTTPLRRETSLIRSTSSVTVVDEAEIANSAAADLPSLLKRYTGVSITSYGGQGASSNVQLRGMSSTQTLVLVNGVRTAAATSGTSSLFNIPLSAIERIEIAKGPHSSQYGADAMGGVINIITKRGGACGDGRNFCGSVTAGVSHPWGAQLSADLRGEVDGLEYSVGGGILGTRGYDFTLPTTWGHEPDDDGFMQGSFNFSLSKQFDWGRLYADGLFSRGRSQYDATAPGFNEVDTTTFAGKAGATFDHTDDWSSTVEFSSGVDLSTNFRDGVPGQDEFDTTRYGVLASTEKSFTTGLVDHKLLGGFEVYRENVDTTLPLAVTGRTLAAGFAQYSLDYGALTVDSGIRHDYNEQFGDATTYNIGASYEFVPGLVGRASYGTGFRAPTFNDLYYPGYSNPDLRPEKSQTYEVGLAWQPNADTSVDLVFYQTWLRDAIASMPPTYIPFNVARARITGFEASVWHAFDERWSGKVTLDVRDPVNLDNGLHIPNRDRFKAGAELNFAATDKLDLSAKVLYVASKHSNVANTTRAPDYVTVDLSASYRFDEKSTMKFSVENLFDETYETVAGYRAPGRTVNLSLTRQF
ncbi:MAG: TonB-dependent receptor [Mesorhizobium sp.]|nr:TonB-dependent receptor [Mesorhizobium sp.]